MRNPPAALRCKHFQVDKFLLSVTLMLIGITRVIMYMICVDAVLRKPFCFLHICKHLIGCVWELLQIRDLLALGDEEERDRLQELCDRIGN